MAKTNKKNKKDSNLVQIVDNANNVIEDDNSFLLHQFLLLDDIVLQVDKIRRRCAEVMRQQAVQHQAEALDNATCSFHSRWLVRHFLLLKCFILKSCSQVLYSYSLILVTHRCGNLTQTLR